MTDAKIEQPGKGSHRRVSRVRQWARSKAWRVLLPYIGVALAVLSVGASAASAWALWVPGPGRSGSSSPPSAIGGPPGPAAPAQPATASAGAAADTSGAAVSYAGYDQTPTAEGPSSVATDSGVTSATAGGHADAVENAAVRYPGAPAVAIRSVTHLDPDARLIAITLDDGLGKDPRILPLLQRYRVTATTFLLGGAVKNDPAFVRKLVAAGFEVANHTWDHEPLTHMSESQIRDELTRTQSAITKITGNQAPYMRPPGGATNSRVRRVAADLGYTTVLWNNSFADTSSSATARQLYKNVIGKLAPGNIVLCHWEGNYTYEALVLILPELQRRGYRAVTISELIAASGGLPPR